MATLKPSELALSRAVLSKIPPRPPGYGRTRELFPRNTGGAFDPIMPATVAADMTVGFLLTNDRAARMVAQKAVDPTLPGLDDVIDRVVAVDVRRARPAAPYEAEIKRVDSGSRGRSADRSRGDRADDAGARDRVAEAEGDSGARRAAGDRRAPTPRSLQLVASDIKRFFDRPGEPARRPTTARHAARRADRRRAG